MKKILLLITVLSAAYHISAQTCKQTLPISVDFSDTSIIPFCWHVVDADKDGLNWEITDVGSGNNGLQSASWTGLTGPLTPDNWVITNAIDLTGYSTSSSIKLKWRVITPDWSFDKERYYVYATTGNQISDFTSSSAISFMDYLDNSDASGRWGNRTFDISALAGKMVYIAFRHYNVTDQNVIDIDDVSLTSSTLAIEDFNKENFSYFYSPNSETLILKSSSKPISSIKIYNLLGQSTISKKLSNPTENIDLSSLTDGIYIAQVEIDNTTKAIKFLKQ